MTTDPNDELRTVLKRERAARAEAERQRFRSRALVAQAIGAEERERGRLAVALHDGPVQDLLAAQLELRRIAEHSGVNADGPLDGIARAVGQLRDAIFALYPPALERLGLAAAVEELAEELGRRHGTPIAVHIDPALPASHQRVAFSVIRELLTNAARHARASQIGVRLVVAEHQILIEVEDDGVGLGAERRAAALKEGRIGLASRAERVEALGGSFEVSRGDDGGTLVRATLPARRRNDREPDAVGAQAERSAAADRRSLQI